MSPMAPPNHPTPPNPYNFLQIIYVLQPFSKVGWSWVVGWKWGFTPMNALHFAREYVASQPPAIAGSKGHNATFRVACRLVGFGLTDAQTLELLREFNARCQPPWTEKELRHKVQDARKKVRLLRGPGARKAVRLTWNPEWFRLCLAALPRLPDPPPPPVKVPSITVPKEPVKAVEAPPVQIRLSVKCATGDLPL